MLKRIVKRQSVDNALDALRFSVDTFPRLDYQPLPWLGKDTARRAAGTESRWQQMLPLLRETAAESCLDIGCNVGWFSINAAQQGLNVIGVESMPKFYRVLLYAARRLELRNLGVLVLELSPGNVSMLPRTDATIFLSVWHHLVRIHGLEEATRMLHGIWSQTQRVLFFDTGENEMPERYGLPAFEPDPATWLSEYLATTCTGGTVRYLGTHAAFGPSGSACERNLFAVIRENGES